jgi:hypothetical protein
MGVDRLPLSAAAVIRIDSARAAENPCNQDEVGTRLRRHR